jgi:hypothetical protein
MTTKMAKRLWGGVLWSLAMVGCVATEAPERTETATNLDTESDGGATLPQPRTSSEEGGSSALPAASTQKQDFTCEPGVVPPELDRGCDTAQDCTIVFFTLGCGCSTLALAHNVAQGEQLRSYLSTCVNQNVCDCPPRLPETDSGETVTSLDEAIAECVDGTCKSRRAAMP